MCGISFKAQNDGRGNGRGWVKIIRRWAGVIVVTVGSLWAGQARADDAPPIKMKETVILNEVGDGKFTLEIKLQVGPYTNLKSNTPNTALLLRRFGLSHYACYEAQDIKGNFDDSTSTVTVSWTTRGLARMVRGHVWEAPVAEGSGLDLISIHDNIAIFSTATHTQLGLATMVVKADTPKGSHDLRLLKSPSRLAYQLPAASTRPDGETSLDFTFQVKPQVMTCMAKLYGNPKFNKMWVARTLLQNTGEAKLKNYRIRFRIPEYSPSWSPWAQCQEVLPGQTVVDGYFPVFELEKVGRVNSTRRATLEAEYRYEREDGKAIELTDSRTFQLLGRNEVYYSSLANEDQVGFYDWYDYGPPILASFVAHDDPIIQQIAGWVSGQAGGVAASASDEGAVKFLASLYDFMVYNQIAYQTSPGARFNDQMGQHVKYGRDVLQNRAGTCIDLAIFYGSVCEAVGLKPVLFLIPGHCFPAIYLPNSGKIFAVEATGIGKIDFQAAVKRGLEEASEALNKGPAYKVDVVDLHNMGVYGLELPPLPPSTLKDWGIRQAPKTVASAPPGGGAPTDNNAPLQLRRYLKVVNNTNEELRIFLQYETYTDKGEWKWFPGHGNSAANIYWDFAAGNGNYLLHDNWKVNARRMRIWAVGKQSGKRWEKYLNDDCWLIPENGYRSQSMGTFTFTFN
jgi:hypothetical protein